MDSKNLLTNFQNSKNLKQKTLQIPQKRCSMDMIKYVQNMMIFNMKQKQIVWKRSTFKKRKETLNSRTEHP